MCCIVVLWQAGRQQQHDWPSVEQLVSYSCLTGQEGVNRHQRPERGRNNWRVPRHHPVATATVPASRFSSVSKLRRFVERIDVATFSG